MSANILIIEDNPPNLDLMHYLLTAFGHSAQTAATGEEGLEVAAQAVPDLVLCDIQLPAMDGYEVVHRLKLRPAMREKPVVAVTAFAMVGDRDKILSAGFDGYIAKPIVPESFVRQVEAFLPPWQRSTGARVSMEAGTEAPPPQRVQHATILLVDDTPENLDVTRSTLEPFGYQVLATNNVREALDLARKNQPDLILSDLHMPGQGGADLLRLVQTDDQLKHIRVIICSATAWQMKQEIERLDLGPEGFISRPVNPQELLAKIQTALQKSRAEGGTSLEG
jgi:two-component system cell cycle response regulator